MQTFREALNVIADGRGLVVDTFEEDIETGELTITVRRLRPFEQMSRDYLRARVKQCTLVDNDVLDLVDELYHRAGR